MTEQGPTRGKCLEISSLCLNSTKCCIEWPHQPSDLTMYSPETALRRSSESEGRTRRDSRVSVDTQQIPPYNNAKSPTQYPSFSPTNGTHPQSLYGQYPQSRPSTSGAMAMSSAISPRLGPPPSPKVNGPPQRSPVYTHKDGGLYYDPTVERTEGQGWSTARYAAKSPISVCTIATVAFSGADNRKGRS